MMRQTALGLSASLAIALILAPGLGAGAATPQPASQAAATAGTSTEAGALFVENVGQFAPAARFLWLNDAGYTWLADDAIWVSVYAQAAPSPAAEVPRGRRPALAATTSQRGAALRLSFTGAKPRPALVPSSRAQTQISYLLGNDPRAWHTNVPVWHGVRYVDLYPGVDLVVGAAGGWPWRLEARNGADLSAVRLRIEGADAASIEGDRLRLTTAAGEFLLPLLHVAGAGQTDAVRDASAQTAGLSMTTPLEVVAPFARGVPAEDALAAPAAATDLIFSTYLGGSSWEQARDIAVGSDGASYVTGETPSATFPITPGAFDATMAQTEVFVTKFNAAGAGLIYSTFLGGNGQEGGWGIALDSSGQAYLAGQTLSANFPTLNAADPTCGSEGTCDSGGQGPYTDAFVTVLNSSGTGLLYSTYLGGADQDYGYAIALDEANAHVAGTTWSSDFAAGYKGDGDAFVARFSSTGSLAYKVLLAGRNTDGGFGIAASGGNAYATGETWSSDFAEGFGGQSDAFVAKLSSSGSVTYRALLGGMAMDRGNAIAVDNLSQPHVTGFTQSANFPVTSGSYGGGQDAFVAKLSSAGGITYAAYLGGSGVDEGLGLALDGFGGFSAAGVTASSNFPIEGDPYAASLAGSSDAFVSRFDLASLAPSKLTYSSYLGGSKYDKAFGVALDGSGRAYLAGYTQSSDFPATAGAYGTSLAGTQDAFVAKIAVARGSLQVTKTVDWNGVAPDTSQTFQICITGPSYPSGSCQITGYNGGILTWSSLIPGSYAVAETEPGPAWTVQVAGSPATVPADGGTASATVTNTRRNGGLQVTKTVAWNGVSPDTNQTFQICITGPSYPSGNCKTTGYNGGTLTWTGLIPGSYTVTEIDPGTMWTATISGSPATVLSDGSTATAAVTNARKLGSLEITKTVNWNGVAPDASQTFQMCIAGPSYPSGNCKTMGHSGGILSWGSLIPGSYTVTETDPGNMWSVVISGSPVTVPDNGGKATASAANTRKRGSLQVTKTMDWNGITPVTGQSFEICISGPSYPAPAKDCKTFTYPDSLVRTWTDLIPGSYSVTETDPGTLWTVVSGSPATVPADGGTGTASVSNTHVPPTPTPTSTSTDTPTPTRTATPTSTSTAMPTNTPTGTPTATATATATYTPSATSTETLTATATATAAYTPSVTPTGTLTATPTATATYTPSATPTGTPTATATATATYTPSATSTGTLTATATATASYTPSATSTGTLTATATATASYTPTATSTGTPTATASYTPTATPTPTLTPTPSWFIHVGDLDGSAELVGGNWRATVSISVHDSNHQPLPAVTVHGQWSGGVTETGVCTTDVLGQCSVVSGAIHQDNTATFTVTELVAYPYTYLPSANHDPDGDSNGTTITVDRNATPTPTATNTATHTPTSTPTSTATARATASPTGTASPTETASAPPIATATPTASATLTPIGTASSTTTPTPTIAGTRAARIYLPLVIR